MSEGKKAIIVILSVLPAAILAGFVLKMLWLWFVCPLGIQPISLPQAIGIDALITYATSRIWQGKIQKDKIFRRWMQGCFCNPPIYLLIGYIAHLFI